MTNTDHTHDSVTIYLQVTDPDGTVRRIRQIDLSEENDWKYTWSNLPMYQMDPSTGEEYVPTDDQEQNNAMKYQYSVVEAYVSGYQQDTMVLQSGTFTEETWSESAEFVNGGYYILRTKDGYLSVVSDSDKLQLVNEATAKSYDLALWKATVSSNKVKLENLATGKSLNYYASGNNRYYNTATSSTSETQNLTQKGHNDGVVLYYPVTTSNGWWGSSTTDYYLAALNNGYAGTVTSQSSALVIYPMQKKTTTTTLSFEGSGFRITNTPLTEETSVKVKKLWDHPFAEDASAYEKLKVTVRLYYVGEDGKLVDTGRTETIDLKSNWEAEFQGLPYKDAEGTPYAYRVLEDWKNEDWIPIYGPITAIDGKVPTYEMTVTNRYRWIDAVELPSTGGIGIILYMLCGLLLVVAPLVYCISLRRKQERRSSA